MKSEESTFTHFNFSFVTFPDKFLSGYLTVYNCRRVCVFLLKEEIQAVVHRQERIKIHGMKK